MAWTLLWKDVMPDLFVSHQGKKYFSATLRTAFFTMGRSQENDLVLTGEGVSKRHARIEKKDGAYWIFDESDRGTLINGKRIFSPSALKTRDRIGIDAWSIEFHDRATVESTVPEASTSRSDNGPVTQIMKPPMVCEAPEGLQPNLLIVRDPHGGYARYPVRKKMLTVGSSPDCDVVIPDECVSRRHLVLSLSELGFTVADADSTNGTFIDGARIREAYLNGDRELVLGRSRLRVCFRKSRDAAGELPGGFFGIVGESPAMLELYALIVKAAATDMTTLILGQTGSGKERVAGVLHELSSRRDKSFVVLNCGAIAQGLTESELFGHEKGAFTGASERRAGAFEQAHGGTLFLDEIGELPLAAQAHVLRAIEYGRVRRLGSDQETGVDVRILAATHRDLAELVAKGRFREDLFYRLYVLPLRIPPLKERGDDALLLARHFLASSGRCGAEFTPCALDKIRAHAWPGNVRELRNAVLRAAAMAESNRIGAADLVLVDPLSHETIRKPPHLHSALTPEEEAEAARILLALRQTDQDKNAAAKLLGMGRSTLFRRIKLLGI